ELLIAPFVMDLHIVQEAAALVDHLQKPTARMIVFAVSLEMIGQVVDALGKDRDLDFGRTGVAGLGAIFLDELLLAFGSNRHSFFSTDIPWLMLIRVVLYRLKTRRGRSSPCSIAANATRASSAITRTTPDFRLGTWSTCPD